MTNDADMYFIGKQYMDKGVHWGDDLSDRTKYFYNREVTAFFNNYRESGAGKIEDASEVEILGYIKDCYPRFVATRSLLNLHVSAIKKWFWDLYGRKIELGRHPDVEQSDIRVLNKKELEKIFSFKTEHVCSNMMRLLFASGLRLDEVLQIRVSDFDHEGGLICLRNSKGVPVHFGIVPDYLNAKLCRQANGKEAGDHLFSLRTERDGATLPVSKRTFQKFMKDATKSCNLGRITAQTLRDNFALRMLAGNVSGRLVSQLLGFSTKKGMRRIKQVYNNRRMR